MHRGLNSIWKEMNEMDEEYLTEDSTLYKGIFWNRLPSQLTHSQSYNNYPRGRVEISNGVAKIFLNGNINYQEVIDFIVDEFNLTTHNGVKKVTVIEDNSKHYLCYLDNGWVPAK